MSIWQCPRFMGNVINFGRDARTRKAAGVHSLRVMRFDGFFSRIARYRLPYSSEARCCLGGCLSFPQNLNNLNMWEHVQVTITILCHLCPHRGEHCKSKPAQPQSSKMQCWKASVRAEDETMPKWTFSHKSLSSSCCLPPPAKFTENLAPNFPGFLA